MRDLLEARHSWQGRPWPRRGCRAGNPGLPRQRMPNKASESQGKGSPSPDQPPCRSSWPSSTRLVHSRPGRFITTSMAESERSPTPLPVSWRRLDYVRRVPCKHGRGRDSGRTAMKLSFHSLRRTAVSLLKGAGIRDAVVMALMGHESAAMSHHYTHVRKEALARAAKTLPAI
jgi:hypothetical protein